MNPIAQKYGAPRLPGINVIPAEIAEKKKMRAVITMAVIAVLIAVGAMLVLFLGAFGLKAAASASRDDAADEELLAVEERDAKSQVYYDVLEREQEEYALLQIGFGEIDQAALTAAIQNTADDESSFDAITIQGPNAMSLGGTEGEESIYGSGIGLVTFEARTTSMDEATALIERLELVPGLANVRATTEQYGVDGGDLYFAVDGSATLTSTLLTQRLVLENGISNVDSLIAPQTDAEESASPTPTPEPSATSEEG